MERLDDPPLVTALPLAEAVRQFEAHFQGVYDGAPTYRCETGDVYHTVVVRDHGVPLPGDKVGITLRGPRTDEELANAWLAEVTTYFIGLPYLYWRRRPEVERCGHGRTSWNQIYSRLVTTDRERP